MISRSTTVKVLTRSTPRVVWNVHKTRMQQHYQPAASTEQRTWSDFVTYCHESAAVTVYETNPENTFITVTNIEYMHPLHASKLFEFADSIHAGVSQESRTIDDGTVTFYK